MSIKKHFIVKLAVGFMFMATLIGPAVINMPSAQAAANPFCWNAESGSAVEISCDGSSANLIRHFTGSAPQRDKCYEFGFSVAAHDYNSPKCSQARETNDNRGTARCMTLSGSINSYHQASFSPSDLNETQCSDGIAAIIRGQNSGFSGFQPGFCYVIAGSSYSAKSCSAHQTNVAAAQSYTDRKIAEAANGEEPIHKVEGKCTARPLTRGDCPVIDYLFRFITALTALVGVVVAVMIVWGGIKYTSAKDNPQQAAEAKETIRNAIIGLVAYFFIYAVLQWLVPGGVL